MHEGIERVEGLPGAERLWIQPWRDDLVEALGHDPRSRYAHQYWLPIVGPSALVAAHALVAGLEASPDGFEIDVLAFGRSLGLPGRAGPNARITRTLDRLTQFSLAAYHPLRPPLYRVRLKWPPLTRRQVERLPEFLAAVHPAA
jgi:hypothetical protein